MSEDQPNEGLPESNNAGRHIRSALQAIGGAIPFAGGLLSAIANEWSEKEQKEAFNFFHQWVRMLEEELKEKEKTILEIMMRLDLHDEKIKKRIKSEEYLALLKKTFRQWSNIDSEAKRKLVRNILANSAATRQTSDDVVNLFIDWINTFTGMHFEVISKVYNNDGITRGEIWRLIGREVAREDSADADLFKLLIRDLTIGGIIRQHRKTDYSGNFILKEREKRPKGSGPKPPISAFDDKEQYELTELGKQFVHYAMTELPPKITAGDDQSEEKQNR